MEFLRRGDLFAGNADFARFARWWQGERYHPSHSFFQPGPALIDGEEIMLDEAACLARNVQMELDFNAMLDKVPGGERNVSTFGASLTSETLPAPSLPSPDGTPLAPGLSLSKQLVIGMEAMGWEQLLLTSLHPEQVMFESWHDHPPYAAARAQFEGLGMVPGFTGGIVMERCEVADHMPQLLQAVFVQALPLAFAAPAPCALFCVVSDRGALLCHGTNQADLACFSKAFTF